MASVKSLPTEYYSRFLSDDAKARQPSPIRSLLPIEARPGLISLLAGKPNSATFPITSLSFNVRSPDDWSSEKTMTIEGNLLANALQYGQTPGIPELLNWVWGLQEFSHGRKKGEGWRSTIGSGSQDVIYKAVTAILNPGDSVLVESPVYAGVIPLFKSRRCEFIEIDTDSEGINTASLRSVLENWPAGKPKPKALYTVPYGCNPTGMTATTKRKQETLQLAKEHDFLILEDDPYFYLYYGADARPPSHFALELQQSEVGRVVRFDSVSKILSSGLRIGFASGPEPILAAMDMHTSTANLQTSSFTQTIAFTLLNSWGYDGFQTHVQKVSEFYRERRDIFEKAMKTHLDGLVEWDTPQAGLFFWFKLLLNPEHPEIEGDSDDIIRNKALENGVLALPGTVFLPNGRKTAYVRASFSLLSEEEVNEALKRLKAIILQARAEKNTQKSLL